MMNPARRLCLAALLLGLAACGEPELDAPASTQELGQRSDAPPWFQEEAAQRGLVFTHHSGAAGAFHMPEIMGGGAALFDMDDDGDLDAYLVQGGELTAEAAGQPGNQLFANDGTGQFEDVTAERGAGERGYGMGVACGDVDADGDTDLYVTNVGANALLLNDGGGYFDDASAARGVDHAGWGTSAAFFDRDKDGFLDLFVCNYLSWQPNYELSCFNRTGTTDYCSPQSYQAPASDVLYANQGDGSFVDVSVEAGIGSSPGNGLGVGCADFDQDGWVDVFVANDGMKDSLWHNLGDGNFVDVALAAGCALDTDGREKAGMGVALADADDDGDEDLLVCNLNTQSDSFFVNQGGSFRDRTAAAGLALVSRPFTRFGMGWADFDDDGVLDLYQANGRVQLLVPAYADDLYAEPNLVYRGTGELRFEEVLPRGGTREELVGTSRAAAFGDVDGDGGVDVLVVNRDAPTHLLINRVPQRGHWIDLRVLDAQGAPALGARVLLQVGEQSVAREVRAAYSYLASSTPLVHVGLGEAQVARDVRVIWPDGVEQSFGELAGGRVLELRQSP